MKLLIGASLLTAVLCTGCEVGMHVESKPAETPVDDATNKGMSGYMEEIRLKDGTCCVTWKSGYAGGLSCDWKHVGAMIEEIEENYANKGG